MPTGRQGQSPGCDPVPREGCPAPGHSVLLQRGAGMAAKDCHRLHFEKQDLPE